MCYPHGKIEDTLMPINGMIVSGCTINKVALVVGEPAYIG